MSYSKPFDSIRYVCRFFKDDKYLYSIHCDDETLQMLVDRAKESGEVVKVIAYKNDSEVSNG